MSMSVWSVEIVSEWDGDTCVALAATRGLAEEYVAHRQAEETSMLTGALARYRQEYEVLEMHVFTSPEDWANA